MELPELIYIICSYSLWEYKLRTTSDNYLAISCQIKYMQLKTSHTFVNSRRRTHNIIHGMFIQWCSMHGITWTAHMTHRPRIKPEKQDRKSTHYLILFTWSSNEARRSPCQSFWREWLGIAGGNRSVSWSGSGYRAEGWAARVGWKLFECKWFFN